MKVGTDCSGIEAPIQALIKRGVKYEHIFSSEIDKNCIKSIKANYNPKIIFGDEDGKFPQGDITKRNIEDVPYVDLYVCGFPCQPFSCAGSRKGFDDKRGNVFQSCIQVITTNKPKIFILENVKNILSHNKGITWNIISKYLDELKKIGYFIKYGILNSNNFNVPQNRERMYIVGTLSGSFMWPKSIKLTKKPIDLIDETDTKEYILNRKHKLKNSENKVFVDLDFLKYTQYPNSSLYSTCVLARSSSLWCVPMKRYANVKEFLRLQCFPDDLIQVVSDSQMKKQIGNSMTVDVVYHILNSVMSDISFEKIIS